LIHKNLSTLLEEPSKRAPVAPEKDEPSRSIGIGIACTVLVHVLLVWLAPKFDLRQGARASDGRLLADTSQEKNFEFELAPQEPEEQVPPPMRFVETNTAAPENTPDKTDNFSDRDQQVAQEKPAEEIDPNGMPSVVGQDEIKNESVIVSGDRSPPQLGAPPVPEVGEEKELENEQLEQLARAALSPLSGFEKNEGLSEDGVASNIASPKDPATNADRLQEGAADSQNAEGGLIAMDARTKAQPRPRQRLSAQSLNRSSILTNRVAGSANVGIQASSAFRSEYGEYLNELIEIVEFQWNRILRESAVAITGGRKVAVRFKLNSAGEIEILNVEETAGKQGTFACLSAIQARQPYRKWSDQMISLLGESQELEFTFHYL
jgi:hypothetical protein